MVMAQYSRVMKNNEIRHVKTAPYHLASNGLVLWKELYKPMKQTSGDSIDTRVASFLFQYRIFYSGEFPGHIWRLDQTCYFSEAKEAKGWS